MKNGQVEMWEETLVASFRFACGVIAASPIHPASG
jgi:hypothetical protein